jgi:hypothetical protein
MRSTKVTPLRGERLTRQHLRLVRPPAPVDDSAKWDRACAFVAQLAPHHPAPEELRAQLRDARAEAGLPVVWVAR